MNNRSHCISMLYTCVVVYNAAFYVIWRGASLNMLRYVGVDHNMTSLTECHQRSTDKMD